MLIILIAFNHCQQIWLLGANYSLTPGLKFSYLVVQKCVNAQKTYVIL